MPCHGNFRLLHKAGSADWSTAGSVGLAGVSDGTGIDDNGQIVVNAYDTASCQYHALLLTPTGDPGVDIAAPQRWILR